MLSMPQDATITSISIVNSGISCSSPPNGFNSLLTQTAPGQYYIDLSQLPNYCQGLSPGAWQSGVNLAINISGTDVNNSNVNTDAYALINGVGLKRLPSYLASGGSQPGSVQLVVPAALVPDNNAINAAYVMLSMPQDATITSISIVNSGISCSSPPNGFNSLLTQTAPGQYYIDLSQLPNYCQGLSPGAWQSGVNLAINISGTDVSTSNVGADGYSSFVFGLKRLPVKVNSNVSSSSQSSFSTYIYQATDVYPNIPIVTVYIDGQPVQLLLDTGASGLVVNQSAVNIPSSDYTSYTYYNTFGDGTSDTGIMASATVCLNPSITNTCVVMPIGVNTSSNAFSTTGERQGDFGLDSGLNIMDWGYNASGSQLIGYSYPYYLEQEYGINSYTLSFYPLSNGYYADVSGNTPIGQLSFGVYNGNSNTLIPYSGGFPSAIGVFPSSSTSFSDTIFFDTGSNFNNLSTDVFQTEIPNFSQSADENACANYGWPNGIVNGGFTISYSTQNIYGTSFTTEPPTSFCQNMPMFNIMLDNTIDNGSGVFGDEDFGLAEMLRHTFTWVLAGPGSPNQGLVQYIGINP